MTTTATATEAVEALADWSTNCEHPTPFALFLDLIGWSEDNYGERICTDKGSGLHVQPGIGYIEASKLAAALEAWSDRPREVEAAVADIIEREA